MAIKDALLPEFDHEMATARKVIERVPDDKFGYKLDHAAALAKSRRLFDILEARLKNRTWLALDRPTIADIACFPYVALGHEGRAPIGDRPGVTAWIARIKALPNFVGMPAL